MALAIQKDQRDQAKAEQKCLIQIFIDTRYVPADVLEARNGPRFKSWGITGPATLERARQLFELWRKWEEEDDQKEASF
jgi:hypothetical protein